MKKIMFCIHVICFCFSLFAQPNLLVDLIHGVRYYTDGNGDHNIHFNHPFNNYNITFMDKTDIILDEELISEIQPGAQQLVYEFDLPDQSAMEYSKTNYMNAEHYLLHCFLPDIIFYFINSIFLVFWNSTDFSL